MFVLIWVLLSVMTCTDASKQQGSKCDENKYTVTLSERPITAEAGLCAVLPCSFTSEEGSVLRNITLHKCDESCEKTIFMSSNNEKIDSEFRGRVSLLEPELKKNCSIIINDLTTSDSGSYKLSFDWVNKQEKNCKVTSKETVTLNVTGLSQKPTVVIPPLTAGQQTTLTCTAPGLCSGSAPNITWSWRGNGNNDSYITGNATEFKTENVTAGTQRHTSTLTFNPSAEHHGTEITCTVSFRGDITTEETKTLNVSYEVQNQLKPNNESQSADLLTELLNIVKKPQITTIIVFLTGFLMGIFLMSIITCLVIKCHRKKQKSSENLVETLEMVTTQAVPLLDQEAEVDVIHDQEAAAEGEALNGIVEPKEVEYSNINFSAMKRGNPARSEKTRDTTETEYAEIKKDEMKARQDADGEVGEVLEGGEGEEEEEGVKEVEMDSVPAEEVGGDEEVAVYSNVNEIMDEI
ncbi:myeloid cell surface antigen CD33-like [Parambassis ranga]|uniref:Myeloid cell surface antigen CD33-like n=1 Tax=Parambassis ranga TaxID=210632 RepID=A0A6P7JUP1_9TELE|nr:myeloid cell surface antigen CD33-like [Parambassis ranga]